ncbi:MAG: protein kinase domain-containing protein, partial [Isosphaeraceae bacterium]
GPARRFLGRSSYVQAVCWIGACLADALSYAHERGLVHLDIKPSNVLLAADGQPMLLDFHLAREPFSSDCPPADGVGGTPGYMSPEQEALVDAIDAGRPAPSGLDARSDLYSLGRVLVEMLRADPSESGIGVAASDPTAREPRFLPGVSTGLVDIIRRCLAIDPADRYPDAAALAEDLRRHMADRPLAGVPNRSLRERWAKWVRRQPNGFLLLRIALFTSCLAGAAAAVVWFAFLAPRFLGAEQSLAEGRTLLEHRSYARAARALTRGAALIEGLPGAGGLEAQLADALRRTARLDEADRLHRLVDQLRLAESAADRAVPSAREVEEHCLALWARRHSLLDRRGLPADPQLEEQLRRDLLDVAVIGSYLRVRRQAGPRAIARAHRASLDLLDEAEALLGPSHVLYLARREHAAALGLSQVANAAARGAESLPPRTAWDHDAAGRILLAAGDLAGAQTQFERALELRPQDVWPNFHQGVCAFRRGRYDEALIAFRVCVALAPDRAECYYNRALALAALRQDAKAARDFDHAGALDPNLADARRAHPRAGGTTHRSRGSSP